MAATPRTPGSGRKASCGVLFFRLSRASGEGLGGALSGLDMRAPEFAILHQLDDAGPISQQALGQALRIHPSNLVAMIDDLEGAGLLIRPRDPADRRRYLLELTDKGRLRLEQARVAALEAELEMLSPLNGREREQLRGLLARVAGHSCAPQDRCRRG
ncbi:MAG: MarR family transcriptional regulator [Solirubrobacterales bacterium]|nr:MarR family transcriptional regulator [Solirubrobacterales bacterium]